MIPPAILVANQGKKDWYTEGLFVNNFLLERIKFAKFVKKENMELSLLIDKFERLPEFLQFEVVDFIDFLVKKYQIEQESILKEDLSELEKKILQQRHQKMQNHPENNLTIEEFKQQILAKYSQK